MSTHIVILAKAPLPGLAKTRLVPALGEQGAAQLAERMLRHTLTEAAAADLGSLELCVTPDAAHPCWSDISSGVRLSEQGDGDLGRRMARAARRALAESDRVLLIGTDCPSLTRDRIKAAARALQHSESVMIPALDGGYVLLGLTAFNPSLFRDIPWSTDQVAHLTRRRVRALGWRLHELEALHDIDEPGDLAHLPAFLRARLPPEITNRQLR